MPIFGPMSRHRRRRCLRAVAAGHTIVGLSVILSASVHADAAATPKLSPCTLSGPLNLTHLEAECGHLSVPIAGAGPATGARIDVHLAVLRAPPAASPAPPVVFLAGGPGQAALQAAPLVAPTLRALREDRDVILIDQRGTGRSAAFDCDFSDAPHTDFADDAQRCLTRFPHPPEHFSTQRFIDDLEAVRVAFGHDRWQLLAVSYGTRVALAYAARHPDRIDRMVLDGVVHPDVALGSQHGPNLDHALTAHAKRCLSSDACQRQFGDLRPLVRSVIEAPHSRWPQSVANPRTGQREPIPNSAELVPAIIRFLSYQAEGFSLLPLLVHRAAHGAPDALLAQGLAIERSLRGTIHRGLELSVICSEDVPHFPDACPASWSLGCRMFEALKARCRHWPVPPAPPVSVGDLARAPPALLLSGALDPVTPPSDAERLRAALPHARHIVLPGQGHGVMARGNMPTHIRDFLKNAPAPTRPAPAPRAYEWPYFTSVNGPSP